MRSRTSPGQADDSAPIEMTSTTISISLGQCFILALRGYRMREMPHDSNGVESKHTISGHRSDRYALSSQSFRLSAGSPESGAPAMVWW